MKVVAYYRVSTQRQGASGLGLLAQRHSVAEFVKQRAAEVIADFEEVESGGKDDRPQLQAALQLSKLTGATLVVAKLDRLSRNVAFLATLQDAGVRFLAVDNPEANELTVHILAAVAQQERKAISQRTKEALAAAKARGIRLGNPNGAAALRRAAKGNSYGVAAVKANADSFARKVQPILEEHRGKSLAAIAEALNAASILSARGGRWHASTVRNVLERLG